jgi:hypothetical protein
MRPAARRVPVRVGVKTHEADWPAAKVAEELHCAPVLTRIPLVPVLVNLHDHHVATKVARQVWPPPRAPPFHPLVDHPLEPWESCLQRLRHRPLLRSDVARHRAVREQVRKAQRAQVAAWPSTSMQHAVAPRGCAARVNHVDHTFQLVPPTPLTQTTPRRGERRAGGRAPLVLTPLVPHVNHACGGVLLAERGSLARHGVTGRTRHAPLVLAQAPELMPHAIRGVLPTIERRASVEAVPRPARALAMLAHCAALALVPRLHFCAATHQFICPCASASA